MVVQFINQYAPGHSFCYRHQVMRSFWKPRPSASRKEGLGFQPGIGPQQKQQKRKRPYRLRVLQTDHVHIRIHMQPMHSCSGQVPFVPSRKLHASLVHRLSFPPENQKPP